MTNVVVGRSNNQCIRCIKEKPMAFIKGNNMMRTKKKSMKVTETTTSGSVGGGSPDQGLGKMHKRAGNLFKGKTTRKPFYEEDLSEQDLIIIPGQGHRLKPGLLPKHNRTDHEVEMAKSDLFQAAKNATEIYKIIRDVPETQGLEGWVQEKIIKANDYLNSVREYLQHRDFDQKMPIDEEASIRQKLKTMLRNMDPTILDKVGSAGIDKVQYGWDLEDQKNLSPEDAKLASKNIRQGNRLRRLAHGENPFTGQPKQMKEMTGGVLAGGMSNFEEGVAEGSEYTPPKEGTVKASIMKNAATPTVQVQVFKHNTLRGDSYWVTKEVKRFKTMDQARAYIDRINKQGVAEGSDQLIGYIDSADGSLITIGYQPGFAKKHGYKDGGFIDALDRAIPNAWKPFYQKDLQQGVAEDNDTVYKDWRKNVGTDYDTTLKLVDKDYNPNAPRNREDELAKMNKKLKGVAEGSEQDFKVGNKVRFKNRTQPAQYMTITDIDRNMFDTKIKLDLVSGWWNPGSLVHYEKQGVAEDQVDEEKDACYNKVKRRYDVWPSAYASGALVKCRKVGASNWGNKSKK